MSIYQLSFHSLFSLDPRRHDFLKKWQSHITSEEFYGICAYLQKKFIEKSPYYAEVYFGIMFGQDKELSFPTTGRVVKWHSGCQYCDYPNHSWVDLKLSEWNILS